MLIADIIYNLYQDMCTYSQLKKKKKFCATPQGVNGAPYISQNCTRLAEKISQNVLKVEA